MRTARDFSHRRGFYSLWSVLFLAWYPERLVQLSTREDFQILFFVKIFYDSIFNSCCPYCNYVYGNTSMSAQMSLVSFMKTHWVQLNDTNWLSTGSDWFVCSATWIFTLIARFMGPMLAPWTLLSGLTFNGIELLIVNLISDGITTNCHAYFIRNLNLEELCRQNTSLYCK